MKAYNGGKKTTTLNLNKQTNWAGRGLEYE